jgi:pyruvate, orthophosphate dikinase
LQKFEERDLAMETTMTTTLLPKKFIYFFSKEKTDGGGALRNTLGGKGANLAEMTSLGLPVPPGFTISTEICTAYYANGQALPNEVVDQIFSSIKELEVATGKVFGGEKNPLLVSVRSGARVSMPGMMDTVLNLGLNDKTVQALADQTGNPWFAWDSYRRFIQMYANVVLGLNGSVLEVALEDLKHEKGYGQDSELKVEDLKRLVNHYKKTVQEQVGRGFPVDPRDQILGAVAAVFRSWNTPRAMTYRELHGYSDDWGTAVNVQAMVFGNLGQDSATGVAFTRNPSTGEREYYGEFLINAQGEDVVAGVRTPQPLTKKSAAGTGLVSLEEAMPAAYQELTKVFETLEHYFKEMQDIEFTIEKNKLWMLQTRTGKRTTKAALRIACEMLDERLIQPEQALLRLDPKGLDQLLHPTLDPRSPKTLLAKALPASPGAAVGQVVFTSEDAVAWAEKGHKVILVRLETSPEDIEGMVAAQGILTSRGGMTSHAAVVARGMGKCCVAGCGDLNISPNDKLIRVRGYELREGDWMTLDGGSGEVFMGQVPTVEPELDRHFSRVMELASAHRVLKVRANADTPNDAKVAREFGAEGIGLCRTEHMFFGADRIDVVRQMILAEDAAERQVALDKLLPMQRSDFEGLFREMQGFPVTIRLLDPPLHEFLPVHEDELFELAKRLRIEQRQLKQKIAALHEFNPMLGHRGCRLGISYPEIYQMQVRAIAEAYLARKTQGQTPIVEIMIPLVALRGEIERLRRLVEVELDRQAPGLSREMLIGTMIELPRAALVADQLAEFAQFFSFGTNDLTQTTLGLSRDDAGKFLGTYVNDGLMESDPFQTLDRDGVGVLVEKAVELGRRTRPDIKLGVCGEHGGDPRSIEFFNSVGLHYVSCSPYRVPVAILAAARANLLQRRVQH